MPTLSTQRPRFRALGRVALTPLAYAANAHPIRRTARFTLHFIEMALAMELGMVALGALNTLILRPIGISPTGRSPEMDVLAMAVFMAAPMVVWMRLRGHGWGHGAEMAAAMFVPFAGTVALHVVGLLSRADMMTFGNDLMWIAMVGIMLVRRRHYAGVRHAHGTQATPPATFVPVSR